MHNRPQRTHKVRPQGRAHLCNPPLRSRLRASGGSRPLNPAQTACARLAGVMPPSGLPLPESARVWIAGFAPSPQPPAPRTRAASRRDPIASAVSTSARVRARRSRRFYTVDSVARSPNSRRPVSTRGVDPDRRERPLSRAWARRPCLGSRARPSVQRTRGVIGVSRPARLANAAAACASRSHSRLACSWHAPLTAERTRWPPIA